MLFRNAYRFLFLLFPFLWLGNGYAQPKIWTLHRVIDLGAVYKQDLQETGLVFTTGEIEIRNVGNQPLILDRLKGDVFTTATYPDGKTIAPEKKGRIQIKCGFSTAQTGPSKKYLTLLSNQSEKIFFQIEAQVFGDEAERVVDAEGNLAFILSEDPNSNGQIAMSFSPTGQPLGTGYYDKKLNSKIGEWTYWEEAGEQERVDETIPVYFAVYDWQGRPAKDARFLLRCEGRQISPRIQSSGTVGVYKLDVPRKPFELTIRAKKDYYTYACKKQPVNGFSEEIWLARPGYPYYLLKDKRIYFSPKKRKYGVVVKEDMAPFHLEQLTTKMQSMGMSIDSVATEGERLIGVMIPAGLAPSKKDSLFSALVEMPEIVATGPLVPHPAPVYALMENRALVEFGSVVSRASVAQLLKGKPFRLTRQTPYSDLFEVAYVGVPGYGMIENFNALKRLEGVTSVAPVFWDK